jgi:hypothetical protein
MFYKERNSFSSTSDPSSISSTVPNLLLLILFRPILNLIKSQNPCCLAPRKFFPDKFIDVEAVVFPGEAPHLAELRQIMEDPVEQTPGLIVHWAIVLIPVFESEVEGDAFEGGRAAGEIEYQTLQVFEIVRISVDLQRQKAQDRQAREPFTKPI